MGLQSKTFIKDQKEEGTYNEASFEREYESVWSSMGIPGPPSIWMSLKPSFLSVQDLLLIRLDLSSSQALLTKLFVALLSKRRIYD